MKRIVLIFATTVMFLTVTALLTGCSGNASFEEVDYVITHQNDFSELILMGAIGSSYIMIESAHEDKTDSITSDNHPQRFAIYKTKGGFFKFIVLNNSRPPQILLTKEFK